MTREVKLSPHVPRQAVEPEGMTSLSDEDDIPIQSSRPPKTLKRRLRVPSIALPGLVPEPAVGGPANGGSWGGDNGDPPDDAGTACTAQPAWPPSESASTLPTLSLASALASALAGDSARTVSQPGGAEPASSTRSANRPDTSALKTRMHVPDAPFDAQQLAELVARHGGGARMLQGAVQAERLGCQSLTARARAASKSGLAGAGASQERRNRSIRTASPPRSPDRHLAAPASWTVQDVCAWVERIGLGQYRKRFVHNAITGALLLRLTPAQIREHLEITILGHQAALWDALRALRKRSDDAAGAEPAMGAETIETGLLWRQQRAIKLRHALERARSREAHCLAEAQHAQRTAELAQAEVRQLRARLAQLAPDGGPGEAVHASAPASPGARLRRDLEVLCEEASVACLASADAEGAAAPELREALPQLTQALRDRLDPDVIEAAERRGAAEPAVAISYLAAALRFRRFERRYQADLERRRQRLDRLAARARQGTAGRSVRPSARAESEGGSDVEADVASSADSQEDDDHDGRAPPDATSGAANESEAAARAPATLAQAKELATALGWTATEVEDPGRLAARVDEFLDAAGVKEDGDCLDDDTVDIEGADDAAGRANARGRTLLAEPWTPAEVVSCLRRCHPDELAAIRAGRGSAQLVQLFR